MRSANISSIGLAVGCSWRLAVGGGWRFVAVGGWWLVIPWGGPEQKKNLVP